MCVSELQHWDTVCQSQIFRKLIYTHGMELSALREFFRLGRDHELLVQFLHNFEDRLMLVTDNSLHHIEDLVDRGKVELADALFILWKLRHKIPTDVKLTHRVDRPNIFLSWMKLYKVRILIDLHSHALVFHRFLLRNFGVAYLVSINILNWVHQKDVVLSREHLMVNFLEVKIPWGLSK